MNRRQALRWLTAGSCVLGLPPLASARPTNVIAGRYGKLPPPGAINRIVSAGPPADVTLFSLAPEKLLGISAHGLSAEQKQYLPTRIGSLPATGRIAGRGSTFPLERLLALKPDLIVDVGNVGESGTAETYLSSAMRVSSQTGIPYVLVDGRLDRTGQQLRELGALIGEEQRAQRQAALADTIIAGARDVRFRLAGRQRLRTYCAIGATGLQTAGAGALHVEALELAGALNVASATGGQRMMQVSMEQLMAWHPDVIVTQDPNFYRRLKQDALWQSLDAVKKQRFHLAPRLPFSWLTYPGINRLLGVLWLQNTLYPQWLPRERYEQLVKQYFELFYDYSLSSPALRNLEESI
jgi:iron complex transport system substrate-binding protein